MQTWSFVLSVRSRKYYYSRNLFDAFIPGFIMREESVIQFIVWPKSIHTVWIESPLFGWRAYCPDEMRGAIQFVCPVQNGKVALILWCVRRCQKYKTKTIVWYREICGRKTNYITDIIWCYNFCFSLNEFKFIL